MLRGMRIREPTMTDINDLQEAMRKWGEAFAAQADYIRDNDIIDSECYGTWLELRAEQDRAQQKVDRLVAICRGDK